MKNKANKLAVALLAVFCLAVPVFVGNMETKAADGDTTYVTEPYTVEKAKEYFTDDKAPTCETTGYIFAGWYAESDTIKTDSETGVGYFEGEPLQTLTGYSDTNVTALFVDEAVLGVKGQIAIMDNDTETKVANMTDATQVNIRLVTSVDTLKYQQVGVKVSYTYNGDKREKENVTNTVYKQLIVADGAENETDEKMVPSQVFSKRSQYFKPCTITGIPADAYEMIFYARAFWITADGATVYGSSTPVEKTVQQGLYHTYEASVGTEDTTEAYYKVLETAVANANTKTVTLLKDAEVSEDMVISGNVKITNRKGANVTIYRASGLTSGNVLSVESGATLNIVGTTDMNSIVFDGRTTNGVAVTGEPLMHSNGGTLFAQNVTIKNTKCTTQSGAIYAQGGKLTVDNSKFIENTGKNGGVIRTSATTTITKCVFGEEGKGNVATADGGAIYSQSKDMKVVDTQFLHNTAPRAGAIYNNGGVLVAKNSKFANNSATSTSNTGSGGAIYQAAAAAKMTLTAQNDEGNSALAVFESNSSATTDATYGGGAICMGNGTFEITGYAFKDNHAASTGGAICIRYNYGTITDASFTGNYTTGTDGYGGAVYVMTNNKTYKTEIINATFTRNYTEGTSAHGGAIYLALKAAGTTITNPTYVENSVGSGASGADIYIAEE